MTGTDLMINDLVDYGVNGRGRICSITPYKVTVTYVNGKQWFVELPLDGVRPIPLSDKILDENFDREQTAEGNSRWVLQTLYFDVSITEETDGLYKIIKDEVEFSSLGSWYMYVCNVHELQHAFHLAGINKIIVI